MGIPPITAVAELLERFEESLRGEQAARVALRGASERVAQLVRTLQGHGVRSAILAVRAAKVYGVQPTVAARQRIASRLRKRVSRVTRGHGFSNNAHGDVDATAVASERKDAAMKSKLIKRVVTTEEYIEPEQDSELETADEESDDDDSRRLRGLVEHAMIGVRKPTMLPLHSSERCYNFGQQPLWAQDFFSVVNRKFILSPQEFALP